MCSERSEDPMQSVADAMYLCKYCNKTLKKPMQSPCSGFRFCKDCAGKLQNEYDENTSCPFCEHPDSSKIHEIYPDKAAERELVAATALCPVQGGGGRGLFQQHESRNYCPMEGQPQLPSSAQIENETSWVTRILARFMIIQMLYEILQLMERQRRQEREQLGAMDRKVKSLERTVALKDMTISELDLRISALEQTSYDGTLLWKITDFSRRRQEAISGRMTSIYSPAFYTSKEGYKMCARLYLNGDGMGKGTHVSLFLGIMRGQYDALLKWPFRQKVTLMFLDQSGKDQHVIDAFRPDPTSSSFKRPTTEMNIASGCPLFMSLTQLDNPLHVFAKDNTGFIKISVSPGNLS